MALHSHAIDESPLILSSEQIKRVSKDYLSFFCPIAEGDPEVPAGLPHFHVTQQGLACFCDLS